MSRTLTLSGARRILEFVGRADEGISMSKNQKRTDTKNKPKLTAKEKKAKKAAKVAKKEGEGGLGVLK